MKYTWPKGIRQPRDCKKSRANNKDSRAYEQVIKYNSGVTTSMEKNDERSRKWKYIPPLVAAMWADSLRGGAQGM